jgi:hypothetical protein
MNNNTEDPTKDLKPRDRYAYLLHLWQCAGQWRASLEIPKTGKRLGFASLEQLFAYLIDLIEGNLNTQFDPEKEPTERSEKWIEE